MPYISIKFCDNILNGLKVYRADTISILIITKVQNSIKMNMGLQFLFSVKRLMTLFALKPNVVKIS